MRERLAVAREHSDFETCAAAAFGDETGNLLLRGIDNHDVDAMRRAKWILAHNLSKYTSIPITRANRTVREVLIYLIDQRCKTCRGQQFVRQETSVRACPSCAGAGLIDGPPLHWRKYHQLILAAALGAMGRALATARASAKAD